MGRLAAVRELGEEWNMNEYRFEDKIMRMLERRFRPCSSQKSRTSFEDEIRQILEDNTSKPKKGRSLQL